MTKSYFSSLIERGKKFNRSIYSLFAVNLFWFLCSYPMTMSKDSILVWGEVKSGNFSDTHTLAFEWYVWLLSAGGHLLFLVSIFQLVLTSFIVYRYFVIFSAKKYSKSLIANLTALVMLSPFAGANATTLWKDVPFALFILLGASYLIMPRFGQKEMFLGGLYLTLGALFRREGFILIIVSFLILILVNRLITNGGKYILPMAKIFFTGFILSLSTSLISSAVFVDSDKTSWVKYAAMLHDLEWIANTNPSILSAENLKKLQLISAESSASNSQDCSSVNGLVYSKGFSEYHANLYASDIPKMWIESLKGAGAGDIAKVRYCRNSAFLPFPLGSPMENGYWVDHGSMNRFQPANTAMDILSKIGLFWIFAWSGNGSILAWPGIHLVFLLVLVFVQVRKHQLTRRAYLLSILAISRLVSLLGVGVAQDYRYQLFTNLLSVILILKLLTDVWLHYGKPSSALNR